MISNTDQEKLTEYFQHEGITKEVLDFFNVKVSKSVKDEIQLEYSYYDGNVKLCWPFSKTKWSWKPVVEANDKPKVFGFEVLPQKGKHLLIAGGEKDVMTLYSLNLNAICFNSENSDMDEELLKSLKARFRDIVILFDNDAPGKKFSVSHGDKHDLPYVKWPENMKGKDVTDFVANGGSKEEIGRFVKSAIQKRLKSLTNISCNDLFRIDINEEDYIIKDVLPANGISGIIGASDTGKSLLLLQLAVSYLIKKPFLNQEVNGGKQVLICSYEDGLIALKKRMTNLIQNLSEQEICIINTNLHFQLYSENSIGDIEEHLTSNPDTGLIVIDPFGDLMQGRDINSTGEVRGVMKSMHNICLQNNLAIVYIHHITKASDKEGGLGKGNSSGSHAIEAKTRVLFELKLENDFQRVLGIVKGNDIPIDMKYPNKKTILEFENTESLWFKISESKILARKAKSNKTNVDWGEVFNGEPELKYSEIKKSLLDKFGIPDSTAEKLIKAQISEHRIKGKAGYHNPSYEEDFEL